MFFRSIVFLTFFISLVYSDEKLDELVDVAFQKASESQLLNPRPEKVVVSAATGDQKYRFGLARFLYTCHQTNPDCLIVALMIDWTEEQKHEFQEVFKEYPIVFTSIDQPITTPEATEIRYQVFRLKASVFKHAYAYFQPPVLWIDADAVVFKSLNSIFKKLKDADFAATDIPAKEIESKFMGQTVGIGNGVLAGEYVERACWYAHHHRGRSFQDQVGMYLAYQELIPRGIVFNRITFLENGYYWLPGTVICGQKFEGQLKRTGMKKGLDQILNQLSP